MVPFDAKSAARQEIRARLAELSVEARVSAARRLRERLLAWPPFRKAQTVLLTASLLDEVNLTPLVPAAQALGKRCSLPAFDVTLGTYVAREWRLSIASLPTGAFGVREPGSDCSEVPFPELDLILVPGLAFTPSGMRLGRGKGYFDRLLSRVPNAISCGLGFDEQVVPILPMEAHDVALDHLLTPSREFDCRALG